MRRLLALPSAVITRLDLVWQGLDLDADGTFALLLLAFLYIFVDQR